MRWCAVADHDDTLALPEQTADQPPAPARRSPDLLNLVMAVISLATAAMVLTDWRPPLDPRWLFAAAAVLVGLALLAASIRPSRRDRLGR
jgi:hypothetical protein